MADRFGHGFAWAPDYDFYWGRKFPLFGMGDRRVKNVKPRNFQVLKQIIPANVMTIGVPGNPFPSLGNPRRGGVSLGGLTEGEIEVQNDALKDYADNLGLAQSLVSQLEQIRPADWWETINAAQEAKQAGVDFFTVLVYGKTGNDEAETQLRDLWVEMGKRIIDLIESRPSILEMMGDTILVYLEDWATGMREVWEGYVGWAMENAGPTLKNYHTAAHRFLELENDLVEADISKEFTIEQIADQKVKVEEARMAVERVKTVFAAIGGGSIDDLAQKNYGQYSISLAQIQIPVAAAIGIAICAAAVAIALSVTLSIGFIKIGGPIAKGAEVVAKGIGDVAKAIGDNIVPISIIAGITILGVVILPAVLPAPKLKTRMAAATA